MNRISLLIPLLLGAACHQGQKAKAVSDAGETPRPNFLILLTDDQSFNTLAIAGPGIPRGQKRDAMVYLYDIYPTLCELAGRQAPASVKGQSFLPSVRDKNTPARDEIFLAYMNLQRAVKDGRYKLILYNVNGERHPQLFDLNKDPLEKNNLYDNPKYSSIRNRLTASLYAHMKASGDFCNPDLNDWGWPVKIKWEDVQTITRDRNK